MATAAGEQGRSDTQVPEADIAPESEQRVTPLELFFDLVLVFALTQVTATMAGDPTWSGLAKGLATLGAVWWAWVGYAWLTNTIDPDEGVARVAVFASMASLLLVALAIPGAFGGDALLFALAYTVVRVLQIVLYSAGTRGEAELQQSIRQLATTTALGCGLILLASAFDGPLQAACWGLALLLDYGGPAVRGVAGWRVSPGHFAERHQLIVIIALGESIVAIGAGVGGLDLGTGEIVAATLGMVLVAALWWAYFDVVALVAERRLAGLTGTERNRMARDSYSYLHFFLVAGIVLMALGIKKTLGDVDASLKLVPAVALCGGLAMYYLGHILFRWRNVHTLSKPRTLAALALLAFVPLATEVVALVALAVVTAIACAVIVFEVVAYAEARERIRHADTH